MTSAAVQPRNFTAGMQALVRLSPSTSAAYLACSPARDSLRVRRPAASTGRAASSFSVKQRMPLSGRARRQQATSHRVKQSDSIQACPLQQQHPLSAGGSSLSPSATELAYSGTPTSTSLPQQRRRLCQDDRAQPRTSTTVIARFLAVAATTSAPAPVLLQQQRSAHDLQRRVGNEQFRLQFLHVTSSSTRQHTSAPAQNSRT